MTRRQFFARLGALAVVSALPWRTRPVSAGISVRFVRHFDVQTDRMPARLDVLYGFGTLRPELAARVSG